MAALWCVALIGRCAACTAVAIKSSLMSETLCRYLTDAQLIFALSLAMFAVSYFFWNDEVIDVLQRIHDCTSCVSIAGLLHQHVRPHEHAAYVEMHTDTYRIITLNTITGARGCC